MELAERTEVLEGEIQTWSRDGYVIVDRSATTAQMSRKKAFSCLAATLSFLFFGIGFLIYMFWYLSKRDEIIYLSVDANGKGKVEGNVPIRAGGVSGPADSLTIPRLVAAVIVVIVVVVVVLRFL